MNDNDQSAIENRHLTATMRFNAYAVRNVVLQDSFPLDPAQFRDLMSQEPILSVIAAALSGGAIGWAATLVGKYLDPLTTPQRWEELALLILVVGASIAHTMAGTFANKNKKALINQIRNHFDSHPREVMSIADSTEGADDGQK